MQTPLKVMVLYGTRPEAIKLEPLIRALHDDARIEPIVVSTGQHRSLLQSANLSTANRVALEFSIFQEGQSVAGLTSASLAVAAQATEQTQPDIVVVHGDTAAALAGAFAAYCQQRPVVHVEAGLRTTNRYSPFPEEMNRRLVTQIADLHLAPTAGAKKNLLAEGVSPHDIVVTGNLVVDALFEALARRPHFTDPRVAGAYRSADHIVLFTMHRRESWGGAMTGLAEAVRASCSARPDVTLVVPMHPNPTVRAALGEGLKGLPTAVICDPLGYDEFVHLMNRAAVILTDSGGIQEEAVTLRKTVLVLREATERPEGMSEGFLRVVGRNPQRVGHALDEALSRVGEPTTGGPTSLIYGDGKAAQRCLSAIMARWRAGSRIADFSAIA